MFEPLGTKLLGRRVGRHTCWADTCRADTLRPFLIWILEFGFGFFVFFSVLGCDGKSNESQRKEKKNSSWFFFGSEDVMN